MNKDTVKAIVFSKTIYHIAALKELLVRLENHGELEPEIIFVAKKNFDTYKRLKKRLEEEIKAL